MPWTYNKGGQKIGWKGEVVEAINPSLNPNFAIGPSGQLWYPGRILQWQKMRERGETMSLSGGPWAKKAGPEAEASLGYWPSYVDYSGLTQGTVPGIGLRPHVMDVEEQLDWMHRVGRRGRADVYAKFTPLEEVGRMRLEKWQGKFQKMRAEGFYGLIDPVSFEQEFAAKKLHIGSKGGEYYQTATAGDTENILEDLEADIVQTREEGVAARKVEKIEPGEMVNTEELLAGSSQDKAAQWLQEQGVDPRQFAESTRTQERELAGGMEGMSIKEGSELFPGSMRARPPLLNIGVSAKGVASRAANWEYFYNNLQAGEGWGRLFRFGKWATDFGFMGKPSASGSTVYSHEAALLNAFKEMTGQTKTLVSITPISGRGVTAGSVDWSNLNITGKYTYGSYKAENRLVRLVDKALAVKEETSIRQAFKAFRDLESGRISLPMWSDYMKDTTLLMKRLKAISKMGNKKIVMRERLAVTKEITDKFLSPLKNYFDTHKDYYGVSKYFEPMNLSKYEDIMEELRGAEIGQIYKTSTGEQLIATEIQSLKDMPVKTSLASKWGGAIAPISELHEEYTSSMLQQAEAAGARRSFRLSAVRVPGIYGEKEFPHAVQLFFGSGEYAGMMQDVVAKKFQKEYASGYLGEVWAEFYKPSSVRKSLTAKIFTEGQEGREALGIVQGTGIYKGKELIDELDEMISRRWQRAFGGAEEMLKADEATKMVMSGLFPQRLHTMKIPFAPLAGEGAATRGSWVGLTIAAGALLLWGASRIGRKEQPISEKDVPNAMYGSSGQPDLAGGPSYTPRTRVTPQNTGYITNIDMEAQDMRGITDYRGIASNLGTMSSSSLGTNRVRTSLHVVDDSSRMDQQSVKRQLNQQLSI